MLENINYIISSIIMIITSIIFSMILLERKGIKITKDKAIAIVIGVVIYSIIIKYGTGAPKTLLIFLFHVIQYKYLFKISYSDSIFLTFLYIVLTIVPDVLVIIFITIWESAQIFYTEYAGTVISTIIVTTMLIMITYIFRKWLRKLLKIKINNNKMIIIYTLSTFICILVIFYNAFENIVLNSNLIVSMIVMLVFVIILYSLIKQKMENDKIVEKYDKLLEFIKKYEIIVEEQREIRHESKNQLITVKSKVLNKEDGEEIIRYVDSLLKDHKSYKEDKYSKFQYLPANGLKGLFYYKAMEAEEKGINLSINIGKRVEDSILSKLTTEDFKQLGRIVGVYIDNAIEASSISKEKKLGIEIYLHNEDVIVIIANTYSGKIDLETVGKVKYSTKGTNRGYGLMLVNKILNNSKRFIAERDVTEKLYIQKLIIKSDKNY